MPGVNREVTGRAGAGDGRETAPGDKCLGSPKPFHILVPDMGGMKYRKLGRTGWEVSLLGYGSSALGGAYGRVDEKDAIKTVRTALDLGINFIDVAPADGLIRAETLLGKALQGVPRESYLLATSVGRYGPDRGDFDFSPARVTRAVDESLRRLRVAHVDLIQCQDIEFGSIPKIIEETLPALEALKRQGKVRKIGITGYALKAIPKVLDHAAVDTVLSYGHYCLLDITLVQMFPYLKAHKVGLINGAPLGMGLHTDKGPPDWHPAPARTREVCARAAEHCRQRKASIAQLALQFAVAQPAIASTLVGTSNPRRLRQNVQWIQAPPDPVLLAEVLAILEPERNKAWPSGRKENN